MNEPALDFRSAHVTQVRPSHAKGDAYMSADARGFAVVAPIKGAFMSGCSLIAAFAALFMALQPAAAPQLRLLYPKQAVVP